MTTIAFTKGELAFDSRVTDSSGSISGAVIKGKQLSTGLLVAAAGDLFQCQLFIKWAEENFINNETKRQLEVQKELCFSGIVVLPSGIIKAYEDAISPIEYTDKIYAWGSGYQYAIGAMEAGCTAAEAVKIAAKRDTHTGGRIRVLRLEEVCKKKPTKRS